MVDLMLDDLNELIRKNKGNVQILRRIKRAVERGEVVSVYERSYVQDLVVKHLRPEYKAAKPDAVVQQPPVPPEPPRRQEPTLPEDSRSISTKTIVIIGIVAVGIIGALIAYTSDGSGTIRTGSEAILLEIQTDSDSYSIEDIILISGTSTSPSSQVTLSITNPSGDLVWVEDDDIDEHGRYTTLTIAGGVGWETGTYTISAIQGETEISAEFDVN